VVKNPRQLFRERAENLDMLDETSRDRLPDHPALRAIVGRAPSLLRVLAQTVRVSRTRLPVLVTGESGTGKELLARALHELGPVAAGPCVAVNCGALSRELAESELFGHERGAFTGAGNRKLGWFEEASGGTLVLDEVGELPLDLQPKLLRVLETGRLRRVGGQGEIAVAVRVVALTLRDLRRDAARGRFRLDLYHRLAGCELRLPPLRERPGDVAMLAQHFLAEAAAELGPRTLTAEARARLAAYAWPGNARELRNVLRRAAVLSERTIDAAALSLGPVTEPTSVDPYLGSRAADAPGCLPSESGTGTAIVGDTLSLSGRSFAEIQAAIFRWALVRCHGSRRRAAASLGISRSTFCDQVRRLGLAAETVTPAY
jgi:two-component system nitrogen regulation response regulator GlnG